MVNRMDRRAVLGRKASRIELLLTDCDGVLTDGNVYYSERGEEMKRFSIRDGMGVERLRGLAGVETGVLSGENSGPLRKRLEKLHIAEAHLGVADKEAALRGILERRRLDPDQVAYIGDDVNDLAVLKRVGLSACPADAMPAVLRVADYVCRQDGGRGAFREFAEVLIKGRTAARGAAVKSRSEET